MNSKPEIKAIIISLSERFERRYGPLWLASNDVDDRENLREKINEWSEEISMESIHPETASRIANMILDKEEFATYPPSLNKFLFLCKEFEKMFSANDNGQVYLAMKKLDERFGFTYGRLWDLQDKDKCKRRLDYWRQELEAKGFNSSTIARATQSIVRKPIFATYPPTLPLFLMECAFSEINEVFIDPSEAFSLACQPNDNMHPAIKGARQLIGSHSMRISKEASTRKRFEEAYLRECDNYVSNQTEYVEQLQINTAEPLEDEAVATNNSEFLKTLQAQCH